MKLDNIGVQVMLPTGNVMNLRARDALNGALRVLLDGGAKLREWPVETRPYEQFVAEAISSDGMPITREQYDAYVLKQLAMPAPTYESTMQMLQEYERS